MARLSSPVVVGVIAGLLFAGTAFIRNSEEWPLIWPALGGFLAVFLAGRTGRLDGFGGALGASARVGLVAGLVFLVLTAIGLYALKLPALEEAARRTGENGDLAVMGGVLLALAIVAVIGLVLALMAGALAYSLSRKAR